MKISTNQFIEKANKIHRGKYDYSNAIYIKAKSKLIITCPLHGNFLQTPSNHLCGKGCPRCKAEKTSTRRRDSEMEFKKKLAKAHGDLYDYSKIEYKGRHSIIEVICKKHGPFFQEANSHLQGHGCPKCGFNISKVEKEFLDCLNIPDKKESRQVFVLGKKVDGIINNVIYEFLGDYWHGNPQKFNPNDYNEFNKTKFGILLENTFKKFRVLKSAGYEIRYIWENEWKQWQKTKLGEIPLIVF